MTQALLVATIPFIVGLAVGRWWLLLMLGLPATTMFAQGANAGMPAGPTAVITLLPVAGAAVGVALRRAWALRAGEPRHSASV